MLNLRIHSILTTGVLTALLWLMPTEVRAADIVDGGGFFSAESITAANKSIRELELKSGHEIRIETFAAVSADKAEAVAKMDAKQRDTFFSKWVFERAEATKSRGIFVLICRDPSHLNLWAGRPIQKAGFGAAQAKPVREAMLTQLKAKEYDRALTDGVAQLATTFSSLSHPAPTASTPTAHGPKSVTHAAKSPSNHVPVHQSPVSHSPANVPQNSPWTGMIVLLMFVVGGIFVISMLGRLFGGGRSGGMGGYGQPGYGGGGGGFLSSLTGGIFGAMAGNWIYDQFSGRHAWGGEHQSSGDTFGSTDSSSGGIDADASDSGFSGGTDFGGGDFGGGGDGGGSDMGGSGDF